LRLYINGGGFISDKETYLKILNALNEHYKKDSLYFVPSSELRSKLNISVEDLRPYIENLEINRFVYKMEGEYATSTFLSKIRHKGIDALKSGNVEIQQSCTFHGPDKLKVLEVLKRESDMGNPYYVPEKELEDTTGIPMDKMHMLAEELEYCGLAKKVETLYPHFTLQITNAGIEYLKNNEGFFGEKKLKHPKYEVFMDDDKQYRFRLKAPNGEEIAVSQAYKTHANCMNGIESVMKNAPIAEIIELK